MNKRFNKPEKVETLNDLLIWLLSENEDKEVKILIEQDLKNLQWSISFNELEFFLDFEDLKEYTISHNG